MNVSRRTFLAAGGTLAATALLPNRLLAALDRNTPAPPKLADWSDVRKQFSLSPDYLHFASFYLASHPKVVRDAIEGYRRSLDAEPYLFVEHNMFESEAASIQHRVCVDIAHYLGARSDELAVTGNTTTGLALIYNGLGLKPGEDVLTTTHDHYSHHESIRFAVERVGGTMRKVELFDRPEAANPQVIVDRLRSGIRTNTRAIGVTWVHSSSGVRLPIRQIADMLFESNRGRDERERCLLVVDGVHGLGAVEDSIPGLGCDFLCAGTHKWMFAPRGTGIIWGNDLNWARIQPTIPTFSSEDSFNGWMEGQPPAGPNTASRVSPGGFTAYEHQWAMSTAFAMHEQMGRARVAGRIRDLNTQCKQGLARMKNVTLHTPMDPALSAGLVAFEVAGVSPGDVVKKLLAKHIVASTSPYKVSYARLAPSLVNTPQEVDRALAAVREIAGA